MGAAPRLEYNVGGTIYCVLETPEELGECVASLAANLKFTVKDCDPATGEPDSDDGYDDEYQLAEGRSSHTLLLSGMFRGGFEVLVRAKLALSDGVAMQLTVRSQDQAVSEIMATAVA